MERFARWWLLALAVGGCAPRVAAPPSAAAVDAGGAHPDGARRWSCDGGEGRRVEGWWYAAPDPGPLVVLLSDPAADEVAPAWTAHLVGAGLSVLDLGHPPPDDVAAAVEALGAEPSVQPGRIALFGHGAAAATAVRVAAAHPELAAVVVAAPDRCEGIGEVALPVLGVCGARDGVIDAAAALDRLSRALEAHPDALVLEFPGLDHLLRPAAGGTDPVDATGSTEAPEAMEVVADWLAERLHR